MEAPVLLKPIPAQVVNEQAAFNPFDLKRFIQTPDGNMDILFRAELKSGHSLPQGLICTTDGILTGIPAKGTQGNHDIIVTAENKAGSIKAEFTFRIKPSLLESSSASYANQLKSDVWQALDKQLAIPSLDELLAREFTPLDMYYMLERWGLLTIWDAFNLDPPDEKILLHLEGTSEHYNIYDRGSCLIACPKDLFSHERTLEDGLQTARVMAREAYKRGWTVELIGFEKLARSAWLEFQHLIDQYGKNIEIINYEPSERDNELYDLQATLQPPRNVPE